MPKAKPAPLEIQILGCGTSTGVPVILCPCKVCRSKNPKNKRLRASAWIQVDGQSFLIDTSTDLREQALRAKIPRLDAVLYTHPHADHVSGIDELRSFNWAQKEKIPLFGNAWTRTDLMRRFPYVFAQIGPKEGGGIPQLEFNEVGDRPFTVNGISVLPIKLMHGSKECLGFRVRSVAYVTDCSYIPEESLSQMEGLDVLVLDCVRLKPHDTHLNLEQALEVVRRVRPLRTFLTHLGHDFDYPEWMRKLPKGVALAHDGLKIRVAST